MLQKGSTATRIFDKMEPNKQPWVLTRLIREERMSNQKNWLTYSMDNSLDRYISLMESTKK